VEGGDIFSPAYKWFKYRGHPAGKRHANPQLRVEPLLASIETLRGGNTTLKRAVLDAVVPITADHTADDANTTNDYYTLTSVLLRLLNRHPERFSETNPDNSPAGSIFIIGHSVEDWHRAYVLWVAYTRQHQNKQYGFGRDAGGTYETTIQDRLTMFKRPARTTGLINVKQPQDPQLLLVRTFVAAKQGLDVSSTLHQQVYDHLCRVHYGGEPNAPDTLSILHAQYVDTIGSIMASFLPTISNQPHTAASALTRFEDQCIVKVCELHLHTTRPAAMLPGTSSTGAAQMTRAQFCANLGYKTAQASSDVPTVEVVRQRVSAVNSAHEIIGTFHDICRPILHVAEHQKLAARILQTVTILPRFASVFGARRTTAGLLTTEPTTNKAVDDRKQIGDPRDHGLSWVFDFVRNPRENRIDFPVARSRCIQFFITHNPILSYIVGHLLKVRSPPKNKEARAADALGALIPGPGTDADGNFITTTKCIILVPNTIVAL